MTVKDNLQNKEPGESKEQRREREREKENEYDLPTQAASGTEMYFFVSKTFFGGWRM